jgi:4-amino-4-deoxy-L-arabinose transferase-like glycosyltransferase
MSAPGSIRPEMFASARRRSGGLRGGIAPARLISRLVDGAAAHGAAERSEAGVRLLDLALIALFVIALRVPSISLSVFGSADESAFILAARELLHGQLPYLTFWDHKPLGSTVLMAGAMAAFGQSIEAVRVLGMACVIGTAWSVYLITQRISPGRLGALAASLLYAAFSTRLNGGIATITEVMFAPFTACGVALLLAAPGRRRTLGLVATFAAAGLAFGIATWIKYVPAVPAALTGSIALLAVLLRREYARAFASGLAFAGGLLLPTAASIAFYWWVGELDEFLRANFGFMNIYAVNAEFGDHPRGPVFFAIRSFTLVFLEIWPLVVTAIAAFLPGCIGPLFDRCRAYFSAVVVVWAVGEMLAVTAQAKFYVYQFLPLLPPLAVLSAVAIRAHASRLALPQKAALATLLVVAFAAANPIVVHARAVAAALSRQDVPREIAKLIAPAMGRGDRVFVANYESIIYFLADAPLPTRIAFPVLLVGPHTSVSPIDTHDEVRRILGEEPKFIVFNLSWRDMWMTWDPEMMALIEETLARDYAPGPTWLAEQQGSIRLFTRRD